MVLGKLPVPGRPTILIPVGQGPTALAAGAGGGCLDIFSLISPISILSPSLWETARYRLKVLPQRAVKPKTTNQPTVVSYGRKYVQEVLINRLGGLSLHRKSVARLTDCPDITLGVYHGRKTTIQQQLSS